MSSKAVIKEQYKNVKVEDYIEYIYSMASLQGLDPENYDILLNCFNSKKVNGYPHVPKEYGMYVAGKE